MRFPSKSKENPVSLFLDLAILSLCLFAPAAAVGGEVPEIGIHFRNHENFTMVEKFNRKHSQGYIFRHDDKTLHIERIEGIDSKSSDILTRDEMTSINALYANSLSAYPGDVSSKIVCNEKFRPMYREEVIDDIFYRYYLLYATARFGLGACSEDIAKYRHLVGWIYCSQEQRLYSIKYFIPSSNNSEELEELFLSLSCSK